MKIQERCACGARFKLESNTGFGSTESFTSTVVERMVQAWRADHQHNSPPVTLVADFVEPPPPWVFYGCDIKNPDFENPTQT
jgi:hypothetical protein